MTAKTADSSLPRLFTIGVSHFCEKARWALDWHGLPYIEERWAIGLHRILAARCGAKGSTLPLLLDGNVPIQGSAEIIDWAESKASQSGRTLNAAHAREIEQRADSLIGVHVRRLSYAEMLPKHAHMVKAELFQGLSATQHLIGGMMWPVTWRLMMRAMNITPSAAAESRQVLEAELDWLDRRLEDGRCCLAGERFSRADIAVASLLAPIARPKEMSIFHSMALPDALADLFAGWHDRPVMRFVVTQYRDHRTEEGATCAS